jgi:hypothetical protein
LLQNVIQINDLSLKSSCKNLQYFDLRNNSLTWEGGVSISQYRNISKIK